MLLLSIPWRKGLLHSCLPCGRVLCVGTFYFENHPNVLDQFLANKNLLKGSAAIKVLPNSTEIVRFPDMVRAGEYPAPVPFGGMGKPVNENGFSDHFPIALRIQEGD
ncbi:MAG: hypothetical protein FJ280_21520 [Planctomycetes bacterium]|nr:hypothetical protein [Planctomycetota bacterium]